MRRAALLALPLTLAVAACGSSVEVTRVDSDKAVDVSGYWNDTDARKVAADMVREMLSRPWVQQFRQGHDGPPRIVVGRVRNKTHEHIDTETITRSLAREITNAGKARFVARREERDYLREERYDQSKHASEDTRPRVDAEKASDFVLQGVLSSTIDKSGGKAVRFYQVNLELVDMETNEKAWLGETRIKKIVKRDRARL